MLRVQKWRGAGPVPQPAVFLDLTSKVTARFQSGLLGAAFHPQCAQNGRFFVCYVQAAADPAAPFQIVVSEFRTNGMVADPSSERVLLVIPKSLGHHNGGCLAFGRDGKLYISTGDNRNQKEAITLTSQNPMSLLGKILRIDVDRADPGLAYAIPADNPWAGYAQGVRREIFAYGLRNPWRFSFDAQGTLWSAEPGTTGEGCREWVTKIQAGANHGWPFFEGTRPLEPLPPNMQGVTFARPYFEYAREAGESATAAVGGYVYRGSRIPALRGRYVFGDNGRGAVYTIRADGPQGSDMQKIGDVRTLSALGEDADGELYALSLEDGVVYTVAPAQ
jgi:glucose/arabinose dehydrogenase